MSKGHQDLVQWFEAHSRPLTLYARQWLDDHAAADLVQEAFLSLLSCEPVPDDVRAWLFRTVRNKALNECRSQRIRRRHARLMANGQSEWFKPRLAEGLDARTAQQALADLPPEQSELIVMRIWGEMTFTRIAEITGESVSTVHAHYMTALETLRKKMVTHVRQTTDK